MHEYDNGGRCGCQTNHPILMSRLRALTAPSPVTIINGLMKQLNFSSRLIWKIQSQIQKTAWRGDRVDDGDGLETHLR